MDSSYVQEIFSISTDHDSQNSFIATTTAANSPELDLAQVKALKRLSDNYNSIFGSPNLHNFFSDAEVDVDQWTAIPVHRCVLSSRSPFFMDLFSRDSNKNVVKYDLKNLVGGLDVGVESLTGVLSYLYSGKVRPLPEGVCVCIDESCHHVGCRPAVDYLLEVLYLSFTFQVSELLNLYQRRLLDILDSGAIDDILPILVVAKKCDKACEKLLKKCIQIIVTSDIDNVALEKSLPPDTVKEITDLRKAQGLIDENTFPGKEVKRIYKALDSDDVELLGLLLKEGHTDINEAYALHYAVAYCYARTVTKLLDLGSADVNQRNPRGFTVLHVAAMRREPEIIMALITRHAWPFHRSSDGRKALEISKRLTRCVDYNRSIEEGRPSCKDKICVEILEQAERTYPPLVEASLCCTVTSNDVLVKLLYLENRVSVATLMFPGEAKVARFAAQVEGTREFVTMTDPLNLTSGQRLQLNIKGAPPRIEQEHLTRMIALSRTVGLAKLFFPRCSDVIDMIMDAEELSELACHGNDEPEQRLKKKQRYSEIEDMLAEAFIKDRVELEKSTGISSSSSTVRIRTARPHRLTAEN